MKHLYRSNRGISLYIIMPLCAITSLMTLSVASKFLFSQQISNNTYYQSMTRHHSKEEAFAQVAHYSDLDILNTISTTATPITANGATKFGSGWGGSTGTLAGHIQRLPNSTCVGSSFTCANYEIQVEFTQEGLLSARNHVLTVQSVLP